MVNTILHSTCLAHFRVVYTAVTLWGLSAIMIVILLPNLERITYGRNSLRSTVGPLTYGRHQALWSYEKHRLYN